MISTRPAVGRLELAFVGAFAGYAGWVALSLTWTRNQSQTVTELQRDIVYPLGLLALVLVVRRHDVTRLLGATLVAIATIAAYALATRLYPDRLGGFDSVDTIASYRLETPIGYWNALGLFAAMGILLAFGFVAHSQAWLARSAAAAALVVLAPALYFTFSRGAWLALGAGAIVLVVAETRRLRLITSLAVAAPAAIVAVLLASQADGLTRSGATLAEATRDGHGLAPWLLLLVAAAFLATGGLAYAERHVRPGEAVRRAYGTALAGAALAGLVLLFVVYGSPPTLVRKAYRSFNEPPIGVRASQSYNRRLFTLSSNGRIDSWKVAWQNYERHPWLGSGAGTYEESWFQLRPAVRGKIRDAHGLYVEVLSELGPVGLALIALGFAVPLAGAIRSRARPLVPAASAAYLAYALHAGGDWDWEMTAVTLTALFIGVALIAGNEERRPVEFGKPTLRFAAAGSLLVVTGFAFVGLLGNIPLAEATTALENERYRQAATDARRAIRWTPWGAKPWQVLGQVRVAQRRFPEARKSLLNAIERAPRDWTIWYDLGTASTGRASACAYFEAARLNPHDPNIAVLRSRGLLPRARPKRCPVEGR